MKHDIHEISNELYNQRQNKEIEKQRKENTKKLKLNSMLILKEEIENFINDLDNDYNINDLQLIVLDNQDIIIDNTSDILIHKDYCADNKEQIRLYLRDKFISQFNIYFREYKTRHNLKKEIEKKKNKDIYNLILDRLIFTFEDLNNQQKYDMKNVLKTMYEEGYILQVFDYLDLDYTTDNKELFYKALNELKRRKKDTIKDNKIKKEKGIPLSWKCYGVLKVIDKMIK